MCEREKNVRVWSDTYASIQGDGGAACPRGETLAGLVAGEIEGTQREQLAEHVLECRRCSEDFRLMAALNEAAREPAPSKPARRAVPRRRLAGRNATFAAAMAITVIAVGIWVLVQPGSPDKLSRSTIQRSAGEGVASDIVPPDGGSLAGPPKRFAWESEDGAAAYVVTLWDEQGQVLWKSPSLFEPFTAIPEKVQEQLQLASSYQWQVDALDPAADHASLRYTFRIE